MASVAADISLLDPAAPSATNPTTPEPPDYVNPLESSSRWYLSARAGAIRYAASFGFSLGNRTDPPAPSPTREIWLDSTLSEWKGRQKIKVEVWHPSNISVSPRPAVINLHGGGWILGQGTDDARWAGALMASLNAIVFTVNYRLAPTYPYPTPVEDSVDAILQIVSRAEEFSFDPTQVIVSGFSAGGGNALGSYVILNDPKTWGYDLALSIPPLAGLVLFYPVLDWTLSRPEKRMGCARPDLTLPKGLTDLIDASYVYPPIPRESRTDPRLSPGLMSDDLIRKLPPVHLCLCEYDMLLAEGLRFAERMKGQEKHHTVRIVRGEKHGWDKPPPMTPKESVDMEYQEAIEAIGKTIGKKCETDTASMASSIKKKRIAFKRPSYLSFRSRSTRF